MTEGNKVMSFWQVMVTNVKYRQLKNLKKAYILTNSPKILVINTNIPKNLLRYDYKL